VKPTVPTTVPGYRKGFKMGGRVEGSRIWRSSDPVTQEVNDIDLKGEEPELFLNYLAFCFIGQIVTALVVTAPTIQKLIAAINHIAGDWNDEEVAA
jgi:hypothetical protein